MLAHCETFNIKNDEQVISSILTMTQNNFTRWKKTLHRSSHPHTHTYTSKQFPTEMRFLMEKQQNAEREMEIFQSK